MSASKTTDQQRIADPATSSDPAVHEHPMGDETSVDSNVHNEREHIPDSKLDGDPVATMASAIAGTAIGGAIGIVGGPVGVIAGMMAGATAGAVAGSRVPDFTTNPTMSHDPAPSESEADREPGTDLGFETRRDEDDEPKQP